MKLSILQSQFKKGLSLIEKIVSRSSALPILSHVLLEAKGNFLKLSATNLEIGLNWQGLAKIEQEGKIVVPALLLSNFVNLLFPKTIELEIQESNLFLKAGTTKTKIKGQSAEEFPIIPQVEKKEKIQVASFPFCQDLAQLSGLASVSNIKPEISGVYLSLVKDCLTLAATDSFRLGEKKIFFSQPLALTQKHSLILPQKSATLIASIFGDKKVPLEIYFSSNLIMLESQIEEVEAPQIQFISKLIEGEYPKYEEIIPQSYSTQVLLKREEFLNEIRAAGLFAGRINEVKFKFQPQGLEVFCQDPDLGEHHSHLAAQVGGEEAEISFNYRFVLDGLQIIRAPQIIFALSKQKGEEGPGIIKPEGDKDYLYVVMPIQSP